jgi:flagellar hook-basal body complex protein FliE
VTVAIGAIGSLAGSAVGAAAPVGAGAAAASDAPQGSPGFVDALGRLVVSAERAGRDANTAVTGMLDGSADVHDAMIALQQAEVALQFTVQVRNKLVQAYQEIMRMPI